VVIDTLSKSMPGLEENSARDMSVVVDRLEQIEAAICCCVLGIHHTGKNKDAGHRGSAVLKDGVDFHLAITEGPNGVRELAVEKMRDGEKMFVTKFRLPRRDGPHAQGQIGHVRRHSLPRRSTGEEAWVSFKAAERHPRGAA
jgi:hypothetical protein